jgi:hypothetical protein
MSYYYKLFTCDCGTLEHQVVISGDEDEKEVYFHYYLNPEVGLLKRLWLAIKYVFGLSPKYGYYGTVTLQEEKARQFANRILSYLDKEEDNG